jgi:hypothetical protein
VPAGLRSPGRYPAARVTRSPAWAATSARPSSSAAPACGTATRTTTPSSTGRAPRTRYGSSAPTTGSSSSSRTTTCAAGAVRAASWGCTPKTAKIPSREPDLLNDRMQADADLSAVMESVPLNYTLKFNRLNVERVINYRISISTFLGITCSSAAKIPLTWRPYRPASSQRNALNYKGHGIFGGLGLEPQRGIPDRGAEGRQRIRESGMSEGEWRGTRDEETPA